MLYCGCYDIQLFENHHTDGCYIKCLSTSRIVVLNIKWCHFFLPSCQIQSYNENFVNAMMLPLVLNYILYMAHPENNKAHDGLDVLDHIATVQNL